MLFFNKDFGVGGVAPYPITANVFLRDSMVEEKHLISPDGKPVMVDRTLNYFVAHVITHQLTGHAIGPVRYYELPQWVREGYADYFGKGNLFDYNEAKRAFLAGTPEMDSKRSGIYWRFHLLMACLLNHQQWTLEQLHQNEPSQTGVEAIVKGEKPKVGPRRRRLLTDSTSGRLKLQASRQHAAAEESSCRELARVE